MSYHEYTFITKFVSLGSQIWGPIITAYDTIHTKLFTAKPLLFGAKDLSQ